MIGKILRYTSEYVTNPARLRRRVAPPTVLSLPITDNCNSRCIMCDVWKEPSSDELSPDQLRGVLENPLFRRLRHVGISGGEPSLRSDLVEVVEVAVTALPNLKSLSITTHGFLVRRWEQFLPPIRDLCAAHGVRLTLNISIDGDADTHDRVRCVPGGFARCLATLRLARSVGVSVDFQATLLAENVYNVGEIARIAAAEEVGVIFRQATEISRLDNEASMRGVQLDDCGRSFLADFLRSRRAERQTPNPARRLFYRDLASRLASGGPRRAPCHFQREALVLAPHGDLFHCSLSGVPFGNALQQSAAELYQSERSAAVREHVHSDLCPGCVHDQTGAWSPAALGAEVLRVTATGRAAELVKRTAVLTSRVASCALRYPAARRRARRLSVQNGDVALLLGAYGGEHVGDAAILGGVVQRLVADVGVRRAVVLSTRPDRTAGWIRGLELPIPVETRSYRQVNDALSSSDMLVYSGGPIMDMPELLALHLDTAIRAARAGVPFLVEGVGIGPFRGTFARTLAAGLLRLASRVRVRDASAASSPLLGEIALVGPDPAHDYLATRKTPARCRTSALHAIERVVTAPEGTLLIGVNLRPLWRKYVPRGRSVAGISDRLKERYVEALANTAREYSASSPLAFVFFAMNADEYGFSDLQLGYDLRARLDGLADVRVCEHELWVDEVLRLMKRLDLVVAMRFHAAIFALSLGGPTLGIDYQVGGGGKVAGLFAQHGLGGGCTSIEEFDSAWLLAGIRGLAVRPGTGLAGDSMGR